MKTEFTSKEVGKILGVKPQFLEDWISRGLITPDLQEGAGAGSRRLFSLKGLCRAALAYHLKKTFRMDRQSILHVLRSCQDDFNWSKSELRIVANIDGPEDQLKDQPYAGVFMAGYKGLSGDFETVIHLPSIVKWIKDRMQAEGIV